MPGKLTYYAVGKALGIDVARQRACQHVGQDLDHLFGALGHGQGGGVDLLERMGMVGPVQDDQRDQPRRPRCRPVWP
jgi:hypothetical protein